MTENNPPQTHEGLQQLKRIFGDGEQFVKIVNLGSENAPLTYYELSSAALAKTNGSPDEVIEEFRDLLDGTTPPDSIDSLPVLLNEEEGTIKLLASSCETTLVENRLSRINNANHFGPQIILNEASIGCTGGELTTPEDTDAFLPKPSVMTKDVLEKITEVQWVIEEPDTPENSVHLLSVDNFKTSIDTRVLLDYLIKRLGEDSANNKLLRKRRTHASDRDISISMDDIDIAKVEGYKAETTNMDDFARYQASSSQGFVLG